MKYLVLFTFSLCFSVLFGQHEVIQALTKGKSNQSTVPVKRNSCSIDSSFIYSADTLELPFLDEFSKTHFQQYETNFSDPGTTSEKYYKLTDLGGNKLPNTERYSAQQTMRKIFNMTELTVVDEVFPTVDIKVADFCAYPVNYSTTSVYPPYIIYDTLGFVNEPDTIWLTEVDYFQDSAVQFFAKLSDKNAYWLDNKAQHNYTNAVNPWSLGVVTFDGTDENGVPYLYNSPSNDFNDYLTSKPIDLSDFSANDSIYFSFLYQAKGFNDEPEAGDSLIVEFFSPQFNQWYHVWSTGGSALNPFSKVHIKVTENKFLQSAFQFRFKNYSGVSGAIDQYHIDYVHLRAFSGYQDTLFKDFAVVYPLNSLLKDYTFAPWEHFRNNGLGKTNDDLKITVRNASNVAENYQNGNLNVSNDGTSEIDIAIFGQNLANGDNNYLSNTVYQSSHDISTFYDFNSASTEDFKEFDVTFNATAQFTNLTVNDSTRFKQRFYDFYAYDDGSAEAAYGPSGVQARLAYQFTPYEDDSLIGVKMKFVESVTDVSNKLFLLTVWNDDNGKPGTEIYQDEFLFPRQPSYDYDDTLGFTNYYLVDFQKLPITGTFYVGWRQIDQTPLNIGFDWNNNNSDKIFYSINNGETWTNSSFEGSLMIRPIFSTNLNKNAGLVEEKISATFNIFPNPSADFIQIETNMTDFKGIQIFDIQGKQVYFNDSSEKRHDISHLNQGVYFVKENSSGLTKKIIKN
jgi:hypothetical protein